MSISLEGDFEAAHVAGDNAGVVATDTMKNTTYAFAHEHLTGAIEGFGLVLARHFSELPQVSAATISIEEHGWEPVPTAAGPAPDAFLRTGELTRTAVIRAEPAGYTIESGLDGPDPDEDGRVGLQRLPPGRLHDPARDERPAAGQPAERELALRLDARRLRRDVRRCLPRRSSRSSPATAARRSRPRSGSSAGRSSRPRQAIDEIRMTMPNLHHWLVDLSPFGQDNDREIFVATSEPYGLIEATVRRSEVAVEPEPDAGPGRCRCRSRSPSPSLSRA